MRAIIDRFEGSHAICEKEDLTMINIGRNLIPIEAKEGDVLIINISIDLDTTDKRKNQIIKLVENL